MLRKIFCKISGHTFKNIGKSRSYVMGTMEVKSRCIYCGETITRYEKEYELEQW